MSKFEIALLRLPEGENLVAEIYYDGNLFAQIEDKNGRMSVHFYTHPDNRDWEVPYEELLQIIETAHSKLLSKQTRWRSLFPPAPSTAAEANQLGQKLLEEILNHPNIQTHQNRFGGMDIYEPSGRGARFDSHEDFLGFLEARPINRGNGFEIVISSDTLYDQLCAEIYFEGEFIAIVTQEDGIKKARVEIHPLSQTSKWSFNLSEFMTILDEAHLNLLVRGKAINL